MGGGSWLVAPAGAARWRSQRRVAARPVLRHDRLRLGTSPGHRPAAWPRLGTGTGLARRPPKRPRSSSVIARDPTPRLHARAHQRQRRWQIADICLSTRPRRCAASLSDTTPRSRRWHAIRSRCVWAPAGRAARRSAEPWRRRRAVPRLPKGSGTGRGRHGSPRRGSTMPGSGRSQGPGQARSRLRPSHRFAFSSLRDGGFPNGRTFDGPVVGSSGAGREATARSIGPVTGRLRRSRTRGRARRSASPLGRASGLRRRRPCAPTSSP